jgi:hypothetical protein
LGGGVGGGVLSVATQEGDSGSTQTMANFVNNLTSANNNVVLLLFSGSAGAFSTAVNNGSISQGSLANVSQIIYVSPAAPNGFGTTGIPTVTYSGNPLVGGVDGLEEALVQAIPVAAPTQINVISDCGHNLECDINSGDISELPDSSNCNSAAGSSENLPPNGIPAGVPEMPDQTSMNEIFSIVAADEV